MKKSDGLYEIKTAPLACMVSPFLCIEYAFSDVLEGVVLKNFLPASL